MLDYLGGYEKQHKHIKRSFKSFDVPINDYILKAAQTNNMATLNRLLPFRSKPESADKQGKNALWYAAMDKNSKLISKLLASGMSASKEDNLGRTPLFIAVDQGCLDCAIQLIKKSQIDHQTGSGNTALIQAATNGNSLLVSWLIQNKATINVRNIRGDTALMMAVNSGSLQSVRLLLKADASITRKNKLGFSAVDFAKQVSPEMVSLVKSGNTLRIF